MPNAQYQLPQQPPPSQSTGQLLNTQPAPQMAADKNVASLSMPANEAMTHLGFANNMLHHLIEFKAGKNGKPTTQPQEQQEDPKEEAKETPQEESQELDKEPDDSGIDQKIAELQSNHEKEIMMLKHELEVQGIKEGNNKKVAEIEAKHKQEIEDLKTTVSTIIRGNA